MSNVSVGFSIPTDNDKVRETLEPRSPSIAARLQALKELHGAGIKTWVFIAPMLPMNPEKLHEAVAPYVSYVMIDRLNYQGKVRSLLIRERIGLCTHRELCNGNGIKTEHSFWREGGNRLKQP
jgi:DNA repair photolyase